MTIRIRIESPAAVDDVLAAIARVHGRPVPAAVADSPVPWIVTAQVRGARFRMRYLRNGSDGDSPHEVRGTVKPSTSGGATVRARAIAFGPYEMVILGVAFAGLAAWIAVFDPEGWHTVLAIGVAVLVVYWTINALLSRSDHLAAFLVECLELAVVEASRRSRIDPSTA